MREKLYIRTVDDVNLLNGMSSSEDTVWGWRIRHRASHIPIEELESMRLQADDLADNCFLALLTKYPQLGSAPADSLRVALKVELGVFRKKEGFEAEYDSQDSRIKKFFRSVCEVPDWLDWELLKEGQAMFLSYSTSSAMGLLYFSLIGGFSAPKIIAVLDKTGYLSRSSKNSTYRRLNETMEMVVDCLEEDDGLREGARGWLSVLKVRLLHARVRYRITEAGDDSPDGGDTDLMDSSTNRVTKGWDAKENGVPINQEDMVGTLLSFSINVIETCERIGAPFLTDHERTAYLHLWRYIGYLIGVREEHNPCSSITRARGAVESIVLHLLHPNERSQTVANHVIRSVSYRPPANFSPQMHSEMARGLLGSELADALALPSNEDDPFIKLYALWVFFVLRVLALVLPFLIHTRSERGRTGLANARKRLRAVVNMALKRGSSTDANALKRQQTSSADRNKDGEAPSAPVSSCPFGYTAASGVVAPHPVYSSRK